MKILNGLLVGLGILGLIGVRIMEDRIFYDPFLTYFHEASKEVAFPAFDWGKLIISHLFRFILNLFFSCMIIYFWFRNKQWTLQGGILMTIVFGITFPIYLYCIDDRFETGYLFSFYMRRFVIQPLILLLLIPMFYYRKSLAEKDL
ncbi:MULTISPECIES: exosortase F system-associated membrane protein [Chryseobacterium]|uniref:Exosortase F-associated protein n=1 Tax=Chryseobacterium camelliae TaxID=1265445 RepID=A0ABU0TN65_9FLAO|nr:MULTISPECIES: exosortase F system-associated protein [Chryseobacterium]MDT3407665.1 exosortase F-associated protein [Pseudacidovorax intermedius]MDQ1098483.1 exosortase F-associated protein [Chryseobacterium camelliae]MDQ1102406.1 exosortase F-associated protein [Chryseobacterium sp. SORGH_AS_1048]MDR6085843.1 exosortase F-associated protein [Chryseobacterium sp. SORGH_AS_0909]MDR6130207.1 exosortase F-associated protein [Chryseobacterium sp. SORGH_AS_1175]